VPGSAVITAANYPLVDAFLTMLWFVLFIIWIFLLIRVFMDIFRSHDLSGWAKALWVVFVIIFPLLGVLLYLIFRGPKMHERDIQQAQANEQAFRSYVQQSAGGSSAADQLARLADLHSRGVLTDEEFAAEKAKVLA
jgi:Short C-terminal domain/Phospholipase_D-nuclease N-terminal